MGSTVKAGGRINDGMCSARNTGPKLIDLSRVISSKLAVCSQRGQHNIRIIDLNGGPGIYNDPAHIDPHGPVNFNHIGTPLLAYRQCRAHNVQQAFLLSTDVRESCVKVTRTALAKEEGRYPDAPYHPVAYFNPEYAYEDGKPVVGASLMARDLLAGKITRMSGDPISLADWANASGLIIVDPEGRGVDEFRAAAALNVYRNHDVLAHTMIGASHRGRAHSHDRELVLQQYLSIERRYKLVTPTRRTPRFSLFYATDDLVQYLTLLSLPLTHFERFYPLEQVIFTADGIRDNPTRAKVVRDHFMPPVFERIRQGVNWVQAAIRRAAPTPDELRVMQAVTDSLTPRLTDAVTLKLLRYA